MYILKTFTGGNYEITEEQNLKLKSKSLGQNVEIDGRVIRCSNIAEIIPIEEYYQQNPNKRPQTQQYKDYTSNTITNALKGMTKVKRDRALKKIIEGFEKHFDGREIPFKSRKMLNYFIRKANS